MQAALLWTATLFFVGPQAELDRSQAESPADTAAGIVLRACKVTVIHQAEVPSKLAGVLEYREVDEGDAVHTGQELARLDDRHAQLQAAVSRLEAQNDVNVRYARKAADAAAAEHESAVLANTRATNTVPAIEVRRLKLQAERGELQIEQAERDLELSRLQSEIDQATLDDHRITSPIDGVVMQVYKNKGEAVAQGEPILKVVGVDRLRVEGFLQVRDTWQVRRGQLVRFQLDVLGADLPVEQMVFQGKVVFVDQFLDPVTGEYRVWAEVNNRDHLLRPGMEGALTILPEQEGPGAEERADGASLGRPDRAGAED